MFKSIENHQDDRYIQSPELKVFVLSNQKGLQNFQLGPHLNTSFGNGKITRMKWIFQEFLKSYLRMKNRSISDFPWVTLLPRIQLNNYFSAWRKINSHPWIRPLVNLLLKYKDRINSESLPCEHVFSGIWVKNIIKKIRRI